MQSVKSNQFYFELNLSSLSKGSYFRVGKLFQFGSEGMKIGSKVGSVQHPSIGYDLSRGQTALTLCAILTITLDVQLVLLFLPCAILNIDGLPMFDVET